MYGIAEVRGDSRRQDEVRRDVEPVALQGPIKAGQSSQGAQELESMMNSSSLQGIAGIKITYSEQNRRSEVNASVDGHTAKCSLTENGIAFDSSKPGALKLAAALAVKTGATGINLVSFGNVSLEQKKAKYKEMFGALVATGAQLETIKPINATETEKMVMENYHQELVAEMNQSSTPMFSRLASGNPDLGHSIEQDR